MNEFKIRCSAISDIMAEPKLKTESLSVGAKTYCENWTKTELYGVQKDFTSKYTSKGNDCESVSIWTVEQYMEDLGIKCGFFTKNQERKENGFMSGECDVIEDNFIIDTKNSWDCFTFPIFDKEPNKAYFAQLQGYMHLFKREKSYLAYVLSDTPEYLLRNEAYLYSQQNDVDFEIGMELMKKKHTYSHLPLNLRVKLFRIDYDAEFIKKVEQKVLICRKYINDLVF